MAKCIACGKRGWRLSVNRNGLCEECAAFVRQDIGYYSKAITHSLEMAKTGKYHAVSMSHLKAAEENCSKLVPYERMGIRIFDVSLNELMLEIQNLKPALVERAISEQTEAARQKAQDAASDAGRIGGYAKAIEALRRLIEVVDGPERLESAIIDIRSERDALKADLLCRKAEVQIAKNKKSKALEYYIDAYMSLRHDGTDDTIQSDIITDIGNRIKELGGDIPQ